MDIQQVVQKNSGQFYSPLNTNDVMRKPYRFKETRDYYSPSVSEKKTVKSANKPNKFLPTLFTTLTLALTGIYIAHRNNLFNPLKRTARKLCKSSELIDKTSEFVTENLNFKNYHKVTKDLLQVFRNDATKPQNFREAAEKVFSDRKQQQKLYNVVKKALTDDPDKVSLKNGYTLAVVDSFEKKIEKILRVFKKNHVEYKSNNYQSVIDCLFTKQNNGSSIAQKSLNDEITKRITSPVENFIKDTIYS